MFRFHGYWGVDYEVHYLVPRLSGGGDWLEPWMREREIEVLQGRPDVGMKGRNRLEKIPPDGDWLWIGYPRRLDMGDLVATVLSDSADSGQVRRVDVSVGNTRDVVLLATQRASYANDDISFDGTFGVLRCEESRGWSALTCLGGGYLTYGELSVAYPGGSVSLVFAETSITGDVSGPGGTVHCAYPAVAGKRCRMSVGHDRRDLRPSVGSLDVPVPPGRHTFSIVWEGEP